MTISSSELASARRDSRSGLTVMDWSYWFGIMETEIEPGSSGAYGGGEAGGYCT